MSLKRRQRQSVNSASLSSGAHDGTFYSDCEPHNSMKLELEVGEEKRGNGSIRFSPRPLSSVTRSGGDPFRRRFARNSVSPRQSSSIGLNGAIGIARSLARLVTAFRSVTTKAKYRVSNLDACQTMLYNQRGVNHRASCAGGIRRGISSRSLNIFGCNVERVRENFFKPWRIKIKDISFDILFQ